MKPESSMVAYYARRAAEYERIYQKPERQEDLGRLREFVERTFGGQRVFELACGTGYWTEILARSAESVLACDLNEEVLAIARSKPMARAKVEFLRADAYALPELPQKFDAGLAAFWWSHVPKLRLRPFLESFHRRFAPGARVIFVDNIYVEGSSTPISRQDGEGNTYQLRELDDGSEHEIMKNFPTDSELHDAIAEAATQVEVSRLEYYWILSYVLNGDALLDGSFTGQTPNDRRA